MSSRELVNDMIAHLPDDSAYRKALRRGDWSDAEYRQAQAINAVACQLDGYQPVLSPMQQHLENAVDDYRVRRHDENLAQLSGERKAV